MKNQHKKEESEEGPLYVQPHNGMRKHTYNRKENNIDNDDGTDVNMEASQITCYKK